MGAFSVNLRLCGVCSCRGSEVPELSSSLRILSLTRSSHCCRIWTASSMEQLSRRMLSIDKSLSPSSRVPVLWKRTRKKNSYKHKCFSFFKLTLPQPCNTSPYRLVIFWRKGYFLPYADIYTHFVVVWAHILQENTSIIQCIDHGTE